ncbi:MAG: L-seryl-tRNA(Sec) selenium transferase [Anaerolineae bacterium]|uniref:L-seryl-tRNA(Sec) selenium transferase n=1 Tax=Thermoflexus sp. TaxID=1969742 RepID=UPI0025FB2ED4|nr:L-seryl-tRNA(Sec) selenium transferase [Thermoflexus sp.]MCS7350885.1 L-seryl-tRNA(Sec) selenium transferase [Thermoflexus sp.]MDW8180336.1 L-seryl-tRNA(Sec) selenium transferase [Anaerolineae bacterium]
MDPRRALPSVDRLLKAEGAAPLLAAFGHEALVEALREVLAEVRAKVQQGEPVPSEAAMLERAATRLARWHTPRPRPVINATGVILHTNLGRAPLSSAALEAIRAASAYSDLEFDLEAGERGERQAAVEELLRRLTGAEAALVVNNNAAAVLLALTTLARGRGVLISRGQLIEIGGGFRIPEVMAQSGARLIEVGTTNRTHLRDYEEPLVRGEDIALILRAHHSNFRMIGFVSEVPLMDLVALGERYGIPVMDDLGSGALLDTAAFGLAHEPMVQESVAAGAAVVCFSGDKLLGGPQAGIMVGKREFLARMRRHPLMRALRPDKLTLAGLSATLIHYLKGEATREIPVWQMIATSPLELEARAREWSARLRADGIPVEVRPTLSTVGGGSLPGETLPSVALVLRPPDPEALMATLRRTHPPIIARVQDDAVWFDVRTVLPDQEADFLQGIRQAWRSALIR